MWLACAIHFNGKFCLLSNTKRSQRYAGVCVCMGVHQRVSGVGVFDKYRLRRVRVGL